MKYVPETIEQDICHLNREYIFNVSLYLTLFVFNMFQIIYHADRELYEKLKEGLKNTFTNKKEEKMHLHEYNKLNECIMEFNIKDNSK